MIISDLDNWRQEAGWLAPPLRRAIEWLEKEVTSDTPVGRYDIEGDRMFVLVQQVETEPREQRLAEAHRRYIDIQLLLSGKELILAARDTGSNEVIANELEDRDLLKYSKVENECELLLIPGTFAIFFPADIHRPCCSVESSLSIRKAVVKIDVTMK